MAYRTEHPTDAKRRAAKAEEAERRAELEALAASRRHAAHARQEEAAQAAQRRAARHQRRDARRRANAAYWNAFVGGLRDPAPHLTSAVVVSPWYLVWLAGTLLVLVLGYRGLIMGDYQHVNDPTPWYLWPFWLPHTAIVTAASLGYLPFWGVKRVLVWRERAWVARLPFDNNYLAVLTDPPTHEQETQLRATLSWRSSEGAVALDTLQDLLRGVDMSWQAAPVGASAELQITMGTYRTQLRTKHGAVHTSDPLRGPMRQLIQQVLLPVHRACPLRGVTFAGKRV